MSKSLGNFFMVIDILEHYDPETLRFFIVSTHYRSPLDFSDARLTEAQKSLARLRQAQETLGELSEMLSAGPTAESLVLREKVKELREAFMEAMRDDFNTALAISHMFALAKEINIYHKAVVDAGIKPDGKLVAMFNDVFAETCSIIGVLEKLLLRLQKRQATARKLSWWKCLSLCVRMHVKIKITHWQMSCATS